MKENLHRIGTWARRQGEHFDLYLHALPQRTRLTLIFAILALLSVTLLFIWKHLPHRTERRIQCTADRYDTGIPPPFPETGPPCR